jgi:para-aminobenzoate synthetase/4-amino-4-deoxychorismate lyase
MNYLRQPDPKQGVFATMLVADGVPLELEAHLARLRRSLHELYGAALPAAASTLPLEHAHGLPLGRLRLSVRPRDVDAPHVEVVVQPVERAAVLPGWGCAHDLRAMVVEGWCGAHKWADRQLLEQLEAHAAPATALLVDGAGAVLETTRANVFAVGADGELRTPPADGTILPGVTRARVIALARDAGVPVREERLTLEELQGAQEAFVTGSVRGVEPVRSLDGTAISGPGSLTGAIAAELERAWFGERLAGADYVGGLRSARSARSSSS